MANDLEARLRAKADEIRRYVKGELAYRGYMGAGFLEKVRDEIAICDDAANFVMNSKAKPNS